jgi:RHS repeat-associated protein
MGQAHFVWDPEIDAVVLETDENYNSTTTYSIEPEHYGRVLSVHEGGHTQTLYFDALGSTRDIAYAGNDAYGTYVYDAWGNQMVVGQSLGIALGWIGELGYYSHDDKTVQVRARCYEPHTARWTSIDPLFDVRRSQYAYGDNSPQVRVDPSGKATCEVTGMVERPPVVPDTDIGRPPSRLGECTYICYCDDGTGPFFFNYGSVPEGPLDLWRELVELTLPRADQARDEHLRIHCDPLGLVEWVFEVMICGGGGGDDDGPITQLPPVFGRQIPSRASRNCITGRSVGGGDLVGSKTQAQLLQEFCRPTRPVGRPTTVPRGPKWPSPPTSPARPNPPAARPTRPIVRPSWPVRPVRSPVGRPIRAGFGGGMLPPPRMWDPSGMCRDRQRFW